MRTVASRPEVAAAVPRAPHVGQQVTLADLLDRLLQGGVVVDGEVTLSVADIDLVRLDLRILLSAIDKAMRPA